MVTIQAGQVVALEAVLRVEALRALWEVAAVARVSQPLLVEAMVAMALSGPLLETMVGQQVQVAVVAALAAWHHRMNLRLNRRLLHCMGLALRHIP